MRSQIGVSQGRGGSGDRRSSSPMNVEAEFRRMQGDRRAASGGGPVQIQRGRCRNRGRRGRGIIHRFGARQEVSEVGSRTIQSLGHWRRSFHDPELRMDRDSVEERFEGRNFAKAPRTDSRSCRQMTFNRARIGWGDPHGHAPEFGPRVRWHSRRTIFPGATFHHS